MTMLNMNSLKTALITLSHRNVRRMSNFRRFVGQTAIVTASTKGIGLACARRLAEEGAKVVISSRSKDNVEKALSACHADGLTNISGLVCDASSADHRKSLVQHALSLNENSNIDIIVSNVANGSFRSLLIAKESTWDKMMHLNVTSHLLLVQECLPYMKTNKKGSIVLIGSISSYIPLPEAGVYATTKACMNQLTKVLASQLGDLNIRVNCVVSGLIDTEMAAPSMVALKFDVENYNLMKRAGQPPEVAGPVAFLCSKDASYITGESIFVSGDQTFTHL